MNQRLSNQCGMYIADGAQIPPYHLQNCRGESQVFRSSSKWCDTCHSTIYENMNPPAYHLKHIRERGVARAAREAAAINKLYAIDNSQMVINKGEYVPLPECPGVTVPKKILQQRAAHMNREAKSK